MAEGGLEEAEHHNVQGLEEVGGVWWEDEEEDAVGGECVEERSVVAAGVPVCDEHCGRVRAPEAAALRLDCWDEDVGDDVVEKIVCDPSIRGAKVENVGEVVLESRGEKGHHSREEDDIPKGPPVGTHERNKGHVLSVLPPALDDRAHVLVDVHSDAQDPPFGERDDCLVDVEHEPRIEPRCAESGAHELEPLAHRLLLDDAIRRDGVR